MSKNEKVAVWMQLYISDADYAIDAIENLARQNGIRITINLGAELANCHDALAELAEALFRIVGENDRF